MTKASCKDPKPHHLRSYFMVDPSTLVTVTPTLLKPGQKVSVQLNKYEPYSRNLDYVEPSGHLNVLSSKNSSIIVRGIPQNQIKSVSLNSCQFYNLFGRTESELSKVKIAPLSRPPIEASTVTISLIKSGHHKCTNFTEHLGLYFKSPKILRPNQVFSLKIPENTPPGISLEKWIIFSSSNVNFTQPTYDVHFKVISAKAGEDEIPGWFSISSDKTNLYEKSNVHEYLPCFVKHQKIDLFYTNEIKFLKTQLNVERFTPLILVGQKGSCKSDLVSNLSGHLGVGLYRVDGTDLCGEAPGALENKLKSLTENIAMATPCVVYLDNLELLGRTRDGGTEDARVLMAVCQFVENLRLLETGCKLFLVGSCCDSSKVALKIRYLFTTCLILTPPQSDTTFRFLTHYLSFAASPATERLLLQRLARVPLRKVLQLLVLLQQSRGRGLNHQETLSLSQCEAVFRQLRLPEGGAGVPRTVWGDIGGIDQVRREIEETIAVPRTYEEVFGPGMRRSGLLLYGAPGCGKTMVARAVACQCNISFMSVQGPELLNSFVGQSEDNVRKIFEDARSVAPTVLFFDEIDAIAPRRTGGVMDRVLAQLLSEMDGVGGSSDIFVIAATNRPELLDPALLRPGRLDRRVEVSVGGDVQSRVAVFQALSRKLKLQESVNFRTVSEMSGPLSGAECYGVLVEACYKAIERCVREGETNVQVSNNDLISSVHALQGIY